MENLFRSTLLATVRVGAPGMSLLTIGCTAGDEQPSASTTQHEGYVTGAGESAGQEEIRLYHRTLGSGRDTLLIVHGGPGAGMYTILPDTRGLADHFVLIYYDQRRGGRSSLPADTMLLAARHFSEDLEAVRAHFGLEKMNVLAHSFGAVLLADYAERLPERLRRIGRATPRGVS